MTAAGRRHWSAAQQDTANALERELAARAAWDELPGLYMITAFPGFRALSPVFVSALLWGDKPDRALALLAGRITAGTAVLHGNAPVSGLAVRTEGWEVITDPGEQSPQPGTLHADPRRAEARFIHAIDRDGTAYLASLRRGQSQPETVVDLPGQPSTIQGTLPDALRLLARAMALAPDTGPAEHPDAPGR